MAININGNLQCPKCNSLNVIGVEYSYDYPEYYDGISEWRCEDCGYREGRWSFKELKDGEYEKAFGK